ncbi:MAG: RNB domain-containing ribonuclease [Porphyromonadaceae bacterium]|nr:MAG: RNB domain-containing ribonuclease [Porphyromonadaceae bacterium]
MIQTDNRSHRAILRELAHIAMTDRGLLPDFSPEVLKELDDMQPASMEPGSIRDLRNLLWCSIDNNDSRDLDQLTVAESLSDGSVRVLVAIADVDALVHKLSPIDDHARQNTTSVYTAAEMFPMLPEKLSTDLTSLNYQCDRLALVVEMVVDRDGALIKSDVYRATVRSQAKLAYDSVGEWIEGNQPMPGEIGQVDGLANNIQLQDRMTRQMKQLRYAQGALDFETIESMPVFDGDMIREMREVQRNRARDIIEELMISSNKVTAGYLASKNFPSFQRVVRKPKRWSRICEIAADYGFDLHEEPDSKALQEFMASEKKRDPQSFPDLSLSIIKLLGPGEYAVGLPGEKPTGHFGLAVRNYSHSTAPNRRYPDLATHRLLKAAMSGNSLPYSLKELEALALHCTEKEDDAKKVERQVSKSAAALVLESRIGDRFDAIVTGAADKGTWVRIMHPHIEGRVVSGFQGLDVGQHIRVELIDTNVERGYIDFRRV